MGHEAKMQQEFVVIYDKDCPLCNRFARAAVQKPALRFLNARENPATIGEAKARGFDIDRGIIVSYRNELHFGADALELMARSIEFRGPTSILIRVVAKYRWAAKLLYPLLAVSRRLLLKVLGRPLINAARD